MALPDPPVTRDEIEPELADVASFDVPELARHQVVVEEVHCDIVHTVLVPLTASIATSWNLEPLQLVPTLLVAHPSLWRTRTLKRRGQPVAGWRQFLFWLGIGIVVAALNSPIDALGEEHFFFVHMVQHVLLGDLAPLC